MGSTNGALLPYPELTDTADGPAAFLAALNSIEDYFYDRILPSGVTRWPTHHWGSGTAFPSGGLVKPGDTYYHSGLRSLMVYDGTSWWQAQGPANMTQAQRQALTTTYSAVTPKGFKVYETDFNRVITWNGSYWRLDRPETLSAAANVANSNINNAWAGTTFGWVAGLGPKVAVPNDGIYRDIIMTGKIQLALAEGMIRIRRDGDADAYAPNSTGLRFTCSATGEVAAAVYGMDLGVVNVARNYYLEFKAAVAGAPNVYVPQFHVEAR